MYLTTLAEAIATLEADQHIALRDGVTLLTPREYATRCGVAPTTRALISWHQVTHTPGAVVGVLMLDIERNPRRILLVYGTPHLTPPSCGFWQNSTPTGGSKSPQKHDSSHEAASLHDDERTQVEMLQRFRAKTLQAFVAGTISCDCPGLCHKPVCPLGELEVEALGIWREGPDKEERP